LKYVENILTRYDKDGLAFQRYGREKQDGLGDDILSGNSLAIIGLYKSIYGINPMYNRMYLNPHLPEKLSGTTLNYNFRGDNLLISLEKGRYSISNARFKLSSTSNFGFNATKNELEYFNSGSDVCSLKAQLIGTGNLSVEIVDWNEKEGVWNQIGSSKTGKITYKVCDLKADNKYSIRVNGQIIKTLKSNNKGCLEFDVIAKADSTQIRVQFLNN